MSRRYSPKRAKTKKGGPLLRGDFLHQPHHSWASHQSSAGDVEQDSDGSRNDTIPRRYASPMSILYPLSHLQATSRIGRFDWDNSSMQTLSSGHHHIVFRSLIIPDTPDFPTMDGCDFSVLCIRHISFLGIIGECSGFV